MPRALLLPGARPLARDRAIRPAGEPASGRAGRPAGRPGRRPAGRPDRRRLRRQRAGDCDMSHTKNKMQTTGEVPAEPAGPAGRLAGRLARWPARRPAGSCARIGGARNRKLACRQKGPHRPLWATGPAKCLPAYLACLACLSELAGQRENHKLPACLLGLPSLHSRGTPDDGLAGRLWRQRHAGLRSAAMDRQAYLPSLVGLRLYPAGFAAFLITLSLGSVWLACLACLDCLACLTCSAKRKSQTACLPTWPA